jgi:hypothetical protein
MYEDPEELSCMDIYIKYYIYLYIHEGSQYYMCRSVHFCVDY